MSDEQPQSAEEAVSGAAAHDAAPADSVPSDSVPSDSVPADSAPAEPAASEPEATAGANGDQAAPPDESEREQLDDAVQAEEELLGAAPVAVAAAQTQAFGSTRQFRSNFALLYAGLGAALVAGIVGLVLIVIAPKVAGPAAWSNWKPSGATTTAIENSIASHVGAEYRQSKGGPPLVDVIAKPPVVTNGTTQISVSVIAIKSATASSGYLTFLTNDMWTADLCGLGAECSIDAGASTTQRGQDVRREALEFALYTFKYTGLTSLVTYLPPPSGSPPGDLLFFQKSSYAKQLSQPLSKTLNSNTPLPTQTDATESKTIDNLTLPEAYSYQPALLQDGSAALVLSPLGVSG